MKPGIVAINEAEQLVLSPIFWTHSKMLVTAVANQNELSNEEKHAKVFECLKILVGDIGQTALDIGIKLAVLWLKSQSQKQ